MYKITDVYPEDEHNKEFQSNVHPLEWRNPRPATTYNLVVIGGGTAGLVSAAGAALLGAKVALVERQFLGGDCLFAGCVPSKALIRASRSYAEVARSYDFGIRGAHMAEADFPLVMERMRRLRSQISLHDSAMRFSEMGVDVFLGHGQFVSQNKVEVNGNYLQFKKAIIATGARPSQLPVEGLAEAGYLTNETVFNLTRTPDHLAVIGGGPIGCELAQAFRRFGCKVTLFHNNPHILDREDEDAAEIIQQVFIREEINLLLKCVIKKVVKKEQGKVIFYEQKGTTHNLMVDEILVGVGRRPNIEGLQLEKAGVEYDARKGVLVNDYLQTSNRNIYAAGDICLPYKFTHTADAAARIAIQNALFHGRKKFSTLTIPWCTYTDPEIAHVGIYERDGKDRKSKINTFIRYLADVDRAIIDGQDEGFVKVHTKAGTDKILGATIVANHAGDMISEITLAMVGNLGLELISTVIHPYPTQAEAIRQVGDLYNRTRLTPFIKKIIEGWLSWTR